MNAQLTPALLVLQDGTVFEGTAIGKIGTTTGEICFNTGMTGYQEVFTDPSYFGQILVMTSDAFAAGTTQCGSINGWFGVGVEGVNWCFSYHGK